MKGKRVLLSAFACDPVFGSDEEVGWQWARLLSDRDVRVTVVTRRAHRNAIEERIAKVGECKDVAFHYVDMPALHRVLSRFNRRNHLYYYLWQWAAYKAAVALHADRPFDLIHHVTWVSFRQPSFMGRVGVPFVFGPVAGADEVPPGYARSFSAKQRAIEILRTVVNATVRFDPLMRMTYRQASKVLFTSEAHLARVPQWVRKKAAVSLAIGMPPVQFPAASVAGAPAGRRLLFVGRCIGLKGMDIGLQAFAEVLRQCPGATLTIVGDGADRPRWMELGQQLGIDGALDWRGWISKDQVQSLYSNFDALFYPSLRDSGGFVVLEALQNGVPVVCLKLGGPGVVVDDSCGAAVEAHEDIPRTIKAFANAVVATLERRAQDRGLSSACIRRAEAFTWDALVSQIYGPLLEVAEEGACREG